MLATAASATAGVFEFYPNTYPDAPTPAQAPASRADDSSFEFTYAVGSVPPGSIRHESTYIGAPFGAAFELTKDNTSVLAGDKITSMVIWTGVNSNLSSIAKKPVNSITNVEIFLTYDLDGEPFYTQSAKLGRDGYSKNTIALTTPYTIEAGKPVYIGYTAKIATSYDYYWVIDDTPTTNEAGGWVGFKKAGDQKMVWDNICSYYGSLFNGVIIEGDNMPENQMIANAIDLPYNVEQNKSTDIFLSVINRGLNEVKNFELSYQIDGGAVTSRTFEVPAGYDFSYNGAMTIQMQGVQFASADKDSEISVWVSKVNGVDNIYTDSKVTGSTYVIPQGGAYQRNVLVEEFTGTGCGWCPSGIVLMDLIREKYTDGTVIPAAGHSSEIGGPDPMQCDKYYNGVMNFVRNRVESFSYPSFIYDRRISTYSPVTTMELMLAALDDERAVPTYAKINAVGSFSDDKKTLNAFAEVTFGINITNTDNAYRIGYLVTEDNVGPYNQLNNFATGTGGECYGWEQKPSTVSWMYDDVVRATNSYPGVACLPAEIKAGQTITVQPVELDLSAVSNPDNIRLIAMIIRTSDMEIVNAGTVSAATMAGIEDVAADASAAAHAIAGAGFITIAGDYNSAAAYNLAGVKVADFANATVSLPAGIYIVNIDGAAAKVIVK